MSEKFSILITDRNPRVRDFLEREFVQEGYHVKLAKDGKDLLSDLEKDASLDLLILDLEIPAVDRHELLSHLKRRFPQLPVVVHSFLEELADQATMDLASMFVEKTENTDKLKLAVAGALNSRYPDRFARSKEIVEGFVPPLNRIVERDMSAERDAIGMRILVVDDEQNIRDGCERVLERRGLKVRKAEDAGGALAYLERTSYALVLLDLKLPGTDGLDLLSRIRERYSDTRVIVITGCTTLETAVEAIQLGAHGFLPKPFKPVQLRTVVDAAIQEKLSAEMKTGRGAAPR